MQRIYSTMSNVERYRILTKPGGLTYTDIATLVGCSKTTAQVILKNIHEKIAATPGALMPVKGRVTRQAFCEHVAWDFEEIQGFAFAELAAVEAAHPQNSHNYGNI